MTEAAYLEVSGVSKRYRQTPVLDDLSLQVGRGEFISLLGPSGCGKTTLLRILAGLVAADRGTVRLAGGVLDALPAHRRNIGVVFQNYALFPHLTVAQNIGFGLKAKGRPKAEIAQAVERSLAMIRLEALADRSVTQLSGGQQQRVAVARALAVGPSLVLLDEPLSALDRKLRETMQIELKRLLRELGMTAIFVTHDQEEALVLSDRIAVMNAGRIEQLGTPREIYARPASAFVLDFVGLSSTLAGRVARSADGEVELATAFGPVRAAGSFLAGSPAMVAVRPERIELGPVESPEWTGIAATVADVAFLGGRRLVYGAVDGDDRILVEVPDSASAIEPGARLDLRWRIADGLVYPAG